VFVFLIPQAVAQPTPPSFLFKFGNFGSGDGQFKFPNGVAVDSSDRIIVGDKQNDRIQVFDSNGNFLFKFGSFCNISTLAGCVDPDGAGPLQLGDGQFNVPSDVAVDSTGRIIVIDLVNARIQVFDSNGIFQFKFGFSSAGGVTTDSTDRIILTSNASDDIRVFDSNGNFLFNFGNIGIDKLTNPADVVVDSTGRFIVTDFTNFRIQVFDLNGNFLFKFGSFGSGDGQFDQPIGVAVDSSDQIIIADQKNHRIQVFDSNGNFLFKFGSFGTGDGQFRFPNRVAVDSTDSIIVLDLFNNRVQVFGTPSIIQVTIDIKPGSDPHSINTKNMGLVTVAILGSLSFDVTQVDVTTLTFGPAGASPVHSGHLEDVNGDGLTDLVSHYVQKQTGLAVGDIQACITGVLLDGTPISGCDSVKVK